MRITDIRPPEDVDRLLTNVASKRPALQFSGDWRHRLKDGTVIDVEITSHTIAFAGRKAVLVVAHDITERRRAEAERLEKEQLRLALNKEAELRRQRDRFVSMVSHEFRTPLTVIAANNGLLERYYTRMDENTRREYFARTEEAVQSLTEMLDDMLTILRAEAIGPRFNPGSLDLVALCAGLAEDTRRNCGGSHQVVFETALETVEAQADADLLRHAVSNLLNNAVKYSPANSIVRLTLERSDDQVVIGVADQGIGIPAAAQAQLFEAFFRAPNARSIPGTGLGLSIARQAVELHGGMLTVESVEGEGSVFKVILPVQPVPNQA
jgi:signal transduction histidine kinase